MDEDRCTAAIWAKMIIESCIACGITHFFIAPGSRSSMLALAVADCPLASSQIFFDERSLAFQALGYAKGSSSTAAIIVTSGTAVANLMPAVMEADASGIPVLVLTADRPWQLRSCCANQTTDQVKLFTSYVRWEMDIPCTDKDPNPSHISSLIAFASFTAQGYDPGPVHLNMVFQEPLTMPEELQVIKAAPTKYISGPSTLSAHDLKSLATLLSCQTGVILITAPEEDRQDIYSLANVLGWPVIEDICARGGKGTSTPYFDLIIKAGKAPNFSCILQFGERTTSKSITHWIKGLKSHYILISPRPIRIDPEALVTLRIVAQGNVTARALSSLCYTSQQVPSLNDLANKVSHILSAVFASNKITEPSLFYWLANNIPSLWDLFIGNSMPVRDADMFFFPEEFDGKIFTSRGLSGIDGNIGLCCGIAIGRQRPLTAVVGDLTFLHDMSSCLTLKSSPYPIILFVINNCGGGIFSFLPVAKNVGHFERYLATGHSYSIESVSMMAGLTYYNPNTFEQLAALWKTVAEEPSSCIIEIKTDRHENASYHSALYQKIQTTLCSTHIAAATL